MTILHGALHLGKPDYNTFKKQLPKGIKITVLTG